MVVLRLSVIPRGPAIGLLAAKGSPPLDCSGQGEELLGVKSGFLRSCCRAVVSLADVLACVHMYMLYVCVYICACMYVYLHVYVYYIYAYVYVYVYVCMYIHVYMYVYAYLYIDCESQ